MLYKKLIKLEEELKNKEMNMYKIPAKIKKPIGMLMLEHRLIERMVELIDKKNERMENIDEFALGLIDDAVRFFREYADRCHHGKEEDILFKELQERNISQEHKEMLDALIEDHIRARKLVAGLDEICKTYKANMGASVEKTQDILEKIVELYRTHIKKEDEIFFPASMGYFSEKERADMIERFKEFDMSLIHDNFIKIVEKYESK